MTKGVIVSVGLIFGISIAIKKTAQYLREKKTLLRNYKGCKHTNHPQTLLNIIITANENNV